MNSTILKYIALTVITLALTGLLCFISFLYGVSQNESEHNAQIAQVTEAARITQAELQGRLTRQQADAAEARSNDNARIAGLKRQLRLQPKAVECVKDDSDRLTAYLSDATLRLLIDAVHDSTLPQAPGGPYFVGTGAPVTADQLAQYTIHIIGQYNDVARQLTQWQETGQVLVEALRSPQAASSSR